MKPHHKFIGLDVHKERNEVALADSNAGVRLYGSISNDRRQQADRDRHG
ncbi:MAG TPA: hypothetical protein VLZ12_14325 [Verrucomicrobiae bacterium]|nr:hypothetical protein [Verrucomicrobiae bacterium]